jgi:NhaP-type Na+/H+ or K+/H+ antiporter
VSADQILTGIAVIVVLAVGSQLLASRLRIPALILLLPAGFTAGILTSDVNPEKLLGPAFQPLVSVSVAVILYDAGLALDLANLTGHTPNSAPSWLCRGLRWWRRCSRSSARPTGCGGYWHGRAR